jgi:hypothetical protein
MYSSASEINTNTQNRNTKILNFFFKHILLSSADFGESFGLFGNNSDVYHNLLLRSIPENAVAFSGRAMVYFTISVTNIGHFLELLFSDYVINSERGNDESTERE